MKNPERWIPCFRRLPISSNKVDDAVEAMSSLMEPMIMVVLGTLIYRHGRRHVPAVVQTGCGGRGMMAFDSTSVAILCGLLGICIGSFLNVVIFRLPKMMENEWQSQLLEFRGDTPSQPNPPYNLATPRSRCPSCSRTIGWQDNIPLVSYF